MPRRHGWPQTSLIEKISQLRSSSQVTSLCAIDINSPAHRGTLENYSKLFTQQVIFLLAYSQWTQYWVSYKYIMHFDHILILNPLSLPCKKLSCFVLFPIKEFLLECIFPEPIPCPCYIRLGSQALGIKDRKHLG